MKRLFKLNELKLGLAVTVVTIVFYIALIPFAPVRVLEGQTLNIKFQLRGAAQPGDDIALIFIDDESIAQLGRWPWSRRLFEALLQRLETANARVVAFDLLFAERDAGYYDGDIVALRAAIDDVKRADATARDGALDAVARKLDQIADGRTDARFARAIELAKNVLVPFSFDFAKSAGETPAAHLARYKSVEKSAFRALKFQEGERPSLPLVGKGLLPVLDTIAGAARTMGHVNVALDADGAARFEYPVVEYRGEYYPSLAVQVAREYLGYALEETRVVFGEGVQIGATWVPTDEAMRMVVNFYGPARTFPSYRFVDVLRGQVPDSAFADKIVLVGANAVGVSDTFVSPFTAVLPGTERIAAVIDNILTGNFIVRRDAYWVIDIAIALVCGLVLGLAGLRLSAYVFSIFTFLFGLMVAAVNFAVFAYANLWLNFTLPVLTLLAAYSAITLFRYLVRERQERRIRTAFGRYLHPSLVDALCKDPDLLRLGGENKELTVLFSDIRNFSAMAERLSAEQLVPLINEYLTVMTGIVFENNGLLDKYIGDGLMAVYGAPIPTESHALQACRTALAMVEATKSLQEKWAAFDLPPLSIRIGINTGNMIIGNMGSDYHFDYTVMGDEVNIGARLESGNKTYGTHIIISAETRELVKDYFATRELDMFHAKGRSAPVRIFELVGALPLADQRMTAARLFEYGLGAYRQRNWAEAIELFKQSLDLSPEDEACGLFIARCQQFSRRPPPSNWNGVALDVPSPV